MTSECQLTESQLLLSQSIQNFRAGAFDCYSIGGMMFGQLIGCVTKVHTLKLCSRLFGESRAARWTSYMLSSTSSILCEGASFHLTPQLLKAGSIESGAWKGCLNSSLTIFSCKIVAAGKLSNPFLQHFAQNCSILGAEEISYRIGISEEHRGSLLERLIAAEISNCQIGAGMGLGRLLCPEAGYAEASYRLQAQFHEISFSKIIPGAKVFSEFKRSFQHALLPELVEGSRKDLLNHEANETKKEKFSLLSLMGRRKERKSGQKDNDRSGIPSEVSLESELEEQKKFIDHAVAALSDSNPEVREQAAKTLGEKIPSLPKQDRLRPTLALTQLIASGNYKNSFGKEIDPCNTALACLKTVTPTLSHRDRLTVCREAFVKLRTEKTHSIYAQIILATCESYLSNGQLYPLALETLRTVNPLKDRRAFDYFLKHWMSRMNDHDNSKLAVEIQKLKGTNRSAQAQPDYLLRDTLIPALKSRGRIHFLAFLVQQGDSLRKLPLETIALLMKGVSAKELMNCAQKRRRPDLLRLAIYHEANIPWDEYIWGEYLDREDPIAGIEHCKK